MAVREIKWPTTEQRQRSKFIFQRKSGIDGIVGAVDGTYVSMKAPKDQIAAYTNRKSFTSITLQVICNEDMVMIDAFVGYPSSAHDVRVFRNSPIFAAIENDAEQFLERGEKIMGDKAYPQLPWTLVPHIDRGRLTDAQKEFNRNQASVRSVVERCFAHLFGRWRRLRHIDMSRTDFIPDVILAACVLHNICLKFKDRVELFVELGREIALRNDPDRG